MTKPRSSKSDLILSAARKEFLAHGFRRTSIEEIARTAGIAKGTVYLYFNSKEEVFHAVLKAFFAWFLGRARLAAKGPDPVEQRLARVLDAKFGAIHQFASSSPYGKELLESSQAVSAGLLRDGERSFVKILTGLLKDTPMSLSASDAAWLIYRAARGSDFTIGAAVTANQMRARLEELARVLLRGLRSNPSVRS